MVEVELGVIENLQAALHAPVGSEAKIISYVDVVSVSSQLVSDPIVHALEQAAAKLYLNPSESAAEGSFLVPFR